MSIQEIAVSRTAVQVAVVENEAATSCCCDYGTLAKMAALTLASYLNGPVCKVREYFYTFYILDEICETTAEKVTQVVLLTLGIIVCTLLTPFTAPLGVGLRGLVASLESEPFIYLGDPKAGKVLPQDRKITLASHNVCCMPAGYAITDGQVLPPSYIERIDANIAQIKALNPDLVCLYEVPDICDASYISSQLPEYPFVIPVAGVRAIGPSSMMYVASKYEIVQSSVAFVPFEKGTELTGRAQWSEKGYLSFDIRSQGAKSSFATVISTHLQHSEIPAKPEPDEVKARFLQMKRIAKLIQQKIEENRNVIFTGDLNMENEEQVKMHPILDPLLLKCDSYIQESSTWMGDKWCAKLMDKPASGPLVLDYTYTAGLVRAISTKILNQPFESSEFFPDVLSDHSLLFSTITLG